MSAVHRLVQAEIELSAAKAQLRLENLRSKRAAMRTTASSNEGALRLAKQITEAGLIAQSWQRMAGLSVVSGSM